MRNNIDVIKKICMNTDEVSQAIFKSFRFWYFPIFSRQILV